MELNKTSFHDNADGTCYPAISQEDSAKVIHYCKEHLDGVWKQLKSPDEIEISKLCGGMTNILYRCALKDHIETSKDEPREVLLRLYGPSHGNLCAQIQIFKQLATERLGPILYKSFDEGRFEEYFPSKPLSWSEITDPAISAAVARKIAAVHKLNVNCIDNESNNWLIDKYNELNAFIVDAQNGPISFSEDTLESTTKLANELLNVDFQLEIDYLDNLFRKSKSPLVFSHNDLHQNNILLLNELNKGHDINDRVVLIDFEYCSYNYRPFDMANHLSEWCFDYVGDGYPYFSASLDRFPSEDRQRQFLRHYLEELGEPIEYKENNNSTNNSICDEIGVGDMDYKVDLLYEDMQPFLMASNMLWFLWAIKSACTSKIKFGYWEMAKWKWDIYLFCKDNFKSQATYGCD